MPRVELRFDGVSRGAVAAAGATRGAIRGVGQEADRQSRRLNLFERSIRYGLTRAMYAAGTGLAVAAGGVAFLGIRFDDLKQRSQIAFSTMLGSGKRAQAFLNQLQAFANKTPFEFTDLVRASQRLLGMGVAAKQIIPTMTAVGNAVAGIGGSAAEIDITVRAIGQIQAKGRLMAEEMMQLNEAGTFSWRDLAREIGTSVPKAMDLVQRGAVTSDAFLEAFQRNSDHRFRGMMERQSHTFGGLVSTIKDQFTQLAGTAMKPLFDLMTRGMDQMVNDNGKLNAKGQTLAHTFGVNLANAVSRLVAFFRRHWQEIVDFLTATYKVAVTLGGALGKIAGAMNTVVKHTIGWKNVMEILIAMKLASVVMGWAGAFTALAGAEAASGAAGGTGMAAAAARGTRLLGVLRYLKGIGLITIGIEVLIHQKEIRDAAGNALDKIFAGVFGDDSGKTSPPGPNTGVVKDAVRALARKGNTPKQIQAWLANRGIKISLAQVKSILGSSNTRIETDAQEQEAIDRVNAVSSGPGNKRARATAAGIVKTASSQIGIPYTWGGPAILGHSTDCSGLAQAVLRKNGINVGRTTYEQWRQGRAVDARHLQPGDLVFFHMGKRGPEHVGIYIGNGQMIEDPHTGASVRVSRLAGRSGFVGARRYMPDIIGGGSTAPDPTSTDPIELGPGGSTGGTRGKATKSTIIGVRGQIDAMLRDLPEGLSKAGLSAKKHLEDLRAHLRVGMSASDLAATRVSIRRWGKVLADEIRKAKDAAAKAATEAADAAARALDRQFSHAQRIVQRDFDRQTQAYVDAFNKQTQDHVRGMQKGLDDQLKGMRKSFAEQMRAFDRETEAGLRSFVVPETGEEAALRQFQAARQAEEDARAMAEAAGDPERLRELELERQGRFLEEQARASREAADANTNAQQDAYREQRDLQRQTLEEQQTDLETSLQDQLNAQIEAYETERGLQLQHWQDLRDDQQEALQNDLEDWVRWITEKKKTWSDFLKWLRARGFSVPDSWIEDVGEPSVKRLFEGAQKVLGDRLAAQRSGATRFQSGGRVPGSYMGREDTVVGRLTPGEEVLDRSLSGDLRAYLARGGGGMGGGVGPIYVLGTTDQEVARALAKLVGPELDRRVFYSADR